MPVTAQAIFDMALEREIHIQTYTDTHIVSCAEDKELVFYRKAIHQPFIINTDLEKELVHAPFKLLAIAFVLFYPKSFYLCQAMYRPSP